MKKKKRKKKFIIKSYKIIIIRIILIQKNFTQTIKQNKNIKIKIYKK